MPESDTTILIVDDNADGRYLLESVLGSYGYDVVATAGADEALRQAERDRPDLIISDVLMPSIDGFEFCRRCKAHPALRSVPFVFYSATYTDRQDATLGVGIGAERFLTKPLESDRLRDAVEEVLGAARAGLTKTEPDDIAPEPVLLKSYNEALVRKLDRKTRLLAQTNRRLGEEVARHQVLARELDARNQALSQFTVAVSHDLRTPLVSLGGFLRKLEAAAGDVASPLPSEGFSRAKATLNRMGTLLDQVLEYLLAGAEAERSAPTDIGQAVQAAVRDFTPRIDAAGAELRVAERFPTVVADRSSVDVVIEKLLDNALKFRREGVPSVIEIGFRPGSEVVFFVADNGTGIPELSRRSVFELFQQLDTETHGTGIGLALVRRIVESMQGRVWIEETTPGGGCTVCFTLPVEPTAGS